MHRLTGRRTDTQHTLNADMDKGYDVARWSHEPSDVCFH